MIQLKATKIKTGEERIFTFDDLYGYQDTTDGNLDGIYLRGNRGEGAWHISFNSGYRMEGINPDFKIEIVE